METNRNLATATENNLPELVQDKIGQTKALEKSIKDLNDITKKAMLPVEDAMKNLQNAISCSQPKK